MKKYSIMLLFLLTNQLYSQDIISTVINSSQLGMCSDGSIDITVNGGYSPYTFEWSNGETTEDLDNLTTGDYSLIVSDAICSQAELSFTIECTCDENCELEAEVDDSTCENFGAIKPDLSCYYFNPSEYQIEWSDGINGRGWDRGGLMPGEYCLTVTDPNDCSYFNCWNVGGADGMFDAEIISFNNVDECDSEMPCNGSIDIEIIQGNGIFTYNWSNGSNAQDLTNVCDGDYSVTVTDQNGCTEILSASLCCCTTIEYIPELNFSSNVAGNCYGDGVESIINPPLLRSGSEVLNQLPNASISTRVSGGTGNYSCQWIDPNGQIISYSCNSGLTGLNEPGEYCFIVEDGCNEIEDCITILDCSLNPVQISAEVNDNCFRFDAAGNISVTVSGGNGPYTYLWTNGASGNVIENLRPDFYCVTVTDSNNCSERFCASINNEEAEYYDRVDCTILGQCNNQIGIIEAIPEGIRVNPEDCRYKQRYCYDGVVLENIYIGTKFSSGGGCMKTESCILTGQYFDTHYGTWVRDTDSGYDSANGCWYCNDIRYCSYPTIPGDEISDFSAISLLALGYTNNGCPGESTRCLFKVYCGNTVIHEECVPTCYQERECKTPTGPFDGAFTYEEIISYRKIEGGNYEKLISFNIIKIDTAKMLRIIKNKSSEKEKSKLITDAELNSFSKNNSSYKDDLYIYPNPAYSELNLKLSSEIKAEKEFSKIEIIDISGKVVYKGNINFGSNQRQKIDIHNLLSGFYIIKLLSNDNKFIVRKFTKVK